MFNRHFLNWHTIHPTIQKITYNNSSQQKLMQPNSMTLQTASAFERIYEAIVGKTDDDLSMINLHLRELICLANQVEEVSSELNN